MKLLYILATALVLFSSQSTYSSDIDDSQEFTAFLEDGALVMMNIDYYQILSKRHPDVTNLLWFNQLCSPYVKRLAPSGSNRSYADLSADEQKELKDYLQDLISSPKPYDPNDPSQEAYLQFIEAKAKLVMNSKGFTMLSVRHRDFTDRLLFNSLFPTYVRTINNRSYQTNQRKPALEESPASSDDDAYDGLPTYEPACFKYCGFEPDMAMILKGRAECEKVHGKGSLGPNPLADELAAYDQGG